MQSATSMGYAKGVSYSTESGVRVSYASSAASTSTATANNNNSNNNNSNSVDEIKSQFFAPEGLYRQMTISEYNRPPKVLLNQTACPISNTLVRVSFVKVPLKNVYNNENTRGNCSKDDYLERICFNVGREIYIYDYGNSETSIDLTNPIDKRVYKGTFPTCHDFNQQNVSLHSCFLLIGFTAGQIQLLDPFQKDAQSKLFNEDRTIEKSSVTFLRWIPGQTSMFAVAYSSGNLYFYNQEYLPSPNPPVYQPLRQGNGYSVFSCKSKTPRNPVQKWTIGHGVINQFEFSNNRDAKYFATAGQDGFLRIFNYNTMEMIGFMKSYFGGLMCLAWSPDLRLIATGGEDDMLTVYSVAEKRVVCRGQGHKSWISQVAFDSCMSYSPNSSSDALIQEDFISSDIGCGKYDCIPEITELSIENGKRNVNLTKNVPKFPPKTVNECTESKQLICTELDGSNSPINHIPSTSDGLNRFEKELYGNNSLSWPATGSSSDVMVNANSSKLSNSTRICYRIGSVGFDTQLCLWDLPGDVLNCSRETIPNDPMSTEANKTSVPSGTSMISGKSNGNKVVSGNTTMISIGISKSFGKADVPSTSSYDQQSMHTKSSIVDAPTEGSLNNMGQVIVNKDTKSKFRKLHKRGLSFGSRDRWPRSNGNFSSLNGFSSASPNGAMSPNGIFDGSLNNAVDEFSNRIFGTAQCPRMDDVPVIEPLVCKKISHERLSVLHFRENFFVTACQEGLVLTWTRPEKIQRSSALISNCNRYYATTTNASADSDGTCV